MYVSVDTHARTHTQLKNLPSTCQVQPGLRSTTDSESTVVRSIVTKSRFENMKEPGEGTARGTAEVTQLGPSFESSGQ